MKKSNTDREEVRAETRGKCHRCQGSKEVMVTVLHAEGMSDNIRLRGIPWVCCVQTGR